MQNIAFSMTTRQFRDRTKTVTRRCGWLKLKAGTRLQGVVKGMGLKKGEHPEALGIIEVVSVGREQLNVITQQEVIREGFPEMTPAEFIEMFCKGDRGCKPETVVTRIEYRYIDAGEKP